jgi:Uma2 family endonuclease
MPVPVSIPKRHFTADEYQRMVHAGILTKRDRVELIDGEIVAKMTVGPRHNACVDRVNRLFGTRVGESAIVRVQGAVRVNLFSELEPDVVLLRPRADFYASGHPGPSEIILIIEVAESSIHYDREATAPLYARSAVHEYWLVDLNENVLDRYSSPERGSYRTVQRYTRGQSLSPELLPGCVISVNDLIGE